MSESSGLSRHRPVWVCVIVSSLKMQKGRVILSRYLNFFKKSLQDFILIFLTSLEMKFILTYKYEWLTHIHTKIFFFVLGQKH